MVARIYTHEGTPELILIHIEIQVRSEQATFPYRMYPYYALLGFKYRCRFFRWLPTFKVGKD